MCSWVQESSNRKHNALFTQTNSTLIVEHSGLALSHGRTKCYQIKFKQSNLRTQICCSHVHGLSCWRHSVENSLAREFACSGGANNTIQSNQVEICCLDRTLWIISGNGLGPSGSYSLILYLSRVDILQAIMSRINLSRKFRRANYVWLSDILTNTYTPKHTYTHTQRLLSSNMAKTPFSMCSN